LSAHPVAADLFSQQGWRNEQRINITSIMQQTHSIATLLHLAMEVRLG
jgi:hypothetical protein